MSTHEIRIDRAVPLADDPGSGHNRWHPDIAPVVRCAPGDEVVLETRDAYDGQVTPQSTDADIGDVDRNRVHPLTGPAYVEGAEPGDVLVVDVLDIEADRFGFTIQVPGFGFLRDLFPDPWVARWDLSEEWAVSPDLPGVRVPAAPFIGTFGVAPSRQLLETISARERALAERGGRVFLPDPSGAVPSDEPIASEGLRTTPPRENGGNVDIRQTVAGTRLYLPVWKEGALFSAGDVHFAQGDNECCGTAIEMSATLRLRLDLRKGEAKGRTIRGVQFERTGQLVDASQALRSRYFAVTGVPVDQEGRNHSEDVTLATRNALLAMIDHLTEVRGFDRQQAYAICSVAVDLRISELPDVPNVLVTAFLPTDIFT